MCFAKAGPAQVPRNDPALSPQSAQRISSSQASQPLATPVVSVTTPSLPPQGLVYSAMPTAYNTGKRLTPLFCDPRVLL